VTFVVLCFYLKHVNFFKQSLKEFIKNMAIKNVKIDRFFVDQRFKDLSKLKTLTLIDCPFPVQNLGLLPKSLISFEITYKDYFPRNCRIIKLTPQLKTFIYTDLSKDESEYIEPLIIDADSCTALKYLELHVLKPHTLIDFRHPRVPCLEILKCTNSLHISNPCCSSCDGVWLQNINTFEISYDVLVSPDLMGCPFYFDLNRDDLSQIKIDSSSDLKTLTLSEVTTDYEFEIVSNNHKRQTTTLELILIPKDRRKSLHKRLLDFSTEATQIIKSRFEV